MNKYLKNKNLYLNVIETDKFKAVNISFDFEDNKDEICEKNIAMEMINNYIDSTWMKKKLIRYYGAQINATTIIRNNHINEVISIEALSPVFIKDKEYNLEKIMSLIPTILNEIIEMDNGEFESILNLSIESLSDKAIKRNRLTSSNIISKFILNIEENEFNSVNRFGNSSNYMENFKVDKIRNILRNIIYKNVLKMYVLGRVDEAEVENIIAGMRRNTVSNSIKYSESDVFYDKKILEIREHSSDFNSNLALGFEVDIEKNDEKYIYLKLVEIMLGRPNGILFNVLREEKNFSYHITVQYNLVNKIFFISLSLNKKSKDEVIKIVKDIIFGMQQGKISHEELNISKKLYKQMLIESLDNPKGMFVIREILELNKENSLSEYLLKIDEAKKSDIVGLLNRLIYKGNYFLEGIS